jgi:hypothetical protein
MIQVLYLLQCQLRQKKPGFQNPGTPAGKLFMLSC